MMTILAYQPVRRPSFRPAQPIVQRPARRAAAVRPSLPVDVVDLGEAFVLTADVPGLQPEQLRVEVLGDTVTLRGEAEAAPAGENGWLVKERPALRFARRLTFPAALDGAEAEAAVENGVLTLRLPKAAQARPQTIKVKAQ